MGGTFTVACLVVASAAAGHAEWTTKYHDGSPWDTTGDPTDLDRAVADGATILRYDDGTYVRAIHRQYPKSCGPSSMAMILRKMGFDDPEAKLTLPLDVDGAGVGEVDVGHLGSMEHLIWLGLHRLRLVEGNEEWNAAEPLLMSKDGILNAEPSKGKVATLAPNGEMGYLGFADEERGPSWLWHSPGIGTRGDDNGWEKLPGIMNYVIAGPWGKGVKDARPLTAFSRTDDEVLAFRRIVKGYIDHEIPILLGVESGGHFNVIIGYSGNTEDVDAAFHIYSAEPLDGWGRSEERQPKRWRRMDVAAGSMFNGSKLIYQYVCWNQHLDGGCDEGGWAAEIDARSGNEWLCGRPVPEDDPLRDPITTTD